MLKPLSTFPARRTRTHWVRGSDEPTFHATRAIPCVLPSENPAEGLVWRIATAPGCFSAAIASAACARQCALSPHP